MVRMNTLVASAILSFGTCTLAAPTADAPVEWTHPIYYKPNAQLSNIVDGGIPAPKLQTVSAADLKPFADVDVPPSNVTTSEDEEDAPVRARGIIGPDNRVLWDNRDYPYSAMGRAENEGSLCSATLVGRRHVAIAKHCVPASGGILFAPQYFDGPRAGSSQVTHIISMDQGDGSCGQKADWAIYILADPLGDQYGYLGAREINCDGEKNQPKFFHLGYPGDHGAVRPYRQEGISVSRCADCAPNGPLETDADAVPGQSGGPLWVYDNGERFVYGVLSGTSAIGSGFASGPEFVNAIAKARVDFP